MAQSSSTAQPVDLDEKIETAESIFDISSVTAQLLSKLAGKSSDSAASLAMLTASTTEATGYQQKTVQSAAESAKAHDAIATNTGESAKSYAAIAANTAASADQHKKIADSTAASVGSLDKIATASGQFSLIAKRGDQDCPVHITIGEKPLRFELQHDTLNAIRTLLTDFCAHPPLTIEIDSLKARYGELERKCRELEEQHEAFKQRYDSHRHHRAGSPPAYDSE